MAEERAYQKYIGKQVRLIVDARAPSSLSESNTSIELSAKIVGETYNHIDLEQVCCKSEQLLERREGNFRRARINKDYLIGVFEE